MVLWNETALLTACQFSGSRKAYLSELTQQTDGNTSSIFYLTCLHRKRLAWLISANCVLACLYSVKAHALKKRQHVSACTITTRLVVCLKQNFTAILALYFSC